jgi:tetratricopeptide (TPR) repeat protein
MSMMQLEDAERELRALIAEGDDDAALHHNLGVCLYHREDWKGAIRELQAARERGLQDPDNLHYLSYALHRVGRLDEAIEACNAWLKLAPSTSTAGYRALLLLDGGDMEGAVRSAAQVVEADPDNTSANLVLGTWNLEQQQMDDALGRFERLTQADPKDARAWVGLALVHLYSQHHKEAIACFEQALVLYPDHVGTIVGLGWTHFTNRDIPAAERTFRHAIKVERNFGEAHGGLALVLVWQNRRTEARREIALARRLDPAGFGLAYATSVMMALDGQRAEGEALLTRNLERTLRPDGASIMDSIRIFLRKQTGAPPVKKMRLPVRR